MAVSLTVKSVRTHESLKSFPVSTLGWWVKEAVDTAETFWSDLISGAQIYVSVLPPHWKGEGVNEVVTGEELLWITELWIQNLSSPKDLV